MQESDKGKGCIITVRWCLNTDLCKVFEEDRGRDTRPEDLGIFTEFGRSDWRGGSSYKREENGPNLGGRKKRHREILELL